MKNLLTFEIQLHGEPQQGCHREPGAKNVSTEYLFSGQHALPGINQIPARNESDIHRPPKRKSEFGSQIVDFTHGQRFSRLQEKTEIQIAIRPQNAINRTAEYIGSQNPRILVKRRARYRCVHDIFISDSDSALNRLSQNVTMPKAGSHFKRDYSPRGTASGGLTLRHAADIILHDGQLVRLEGSDLTENRLILYCQV
jgi:hypothetical protein